MKNIHHITLATLCLFLPSGATSLMASDLQAILDRGEDLLLERKSVHILEEPLRFTREGQKIFTKEAVLPEDFATLRLAPGAEGCLILADSIPGIIIERLIIDGNRYGLQTPDGRVRHTPLISLGRSGVDIKGNGRSGLEQPLGWGDGISTEGRNSLVRNNLIESLGSRIHIGLAMGGPCWGNKLLGTTLVGASVEDNLIRGKASGYGYAANGIDEFIIRGNRSEATYSGIGDGLPGNPPDPGQHRPYKEIAHDNRGFPGKIRFPGSARHAGFPHPVLVGLNYFRMQGYDRIRQ